AGGDQGPTIDAQAGPFTVMLGDPAPNASWTSSHTGGKTFFAGSCGPCDPGPRITIASGTDAPEDWKRYEPATLRGLSIAVIFFTDLDRGWVIANVAGEGGAIYATTDGGATWSKQFESADLAPPVG
ncbi:MAG: hypothetical protein ACRDJM_00355, partial [Actinomycetota bacterium]